MQAEKEKESIMGRYNGPGCRQCRREGVKLMLKGKRCTMAKCPIETGRASPGVHGQRRGKKLSDYGVQLREKQKLRRMYGMQEGQFRLFFDRAQRSKGVTGDKLLQLLEMRLDNIIYRLGFSFSRKSARQFVTHRHIKINGRIVNIPSMGVKPGSVIEVKDNPKSRAHASQSLEASQARVVPGWMSIDAANFKGEVLKVPTREEIAPIVNEQLIVELYSK